MTQHPPARSITQGLLATAALVGLAFMAVPATADMTRDGEEYYCEEHQYGPTCNPCAQGQSLVVVPTLSDLSDLSVTVSMIKYKLARETGPYEDNDRYYERVEEPAQPEVEEKEGPEWGSEGGPCDPTECPHGMTGCGHGHDHDPRG